MNINNEFSDQSLPVDSYSTLEPVNTPDCDYVLPSTGPLHSSQASSSTDNHVQYIDSSIMNTSKDSNGKSNNDVDQDNNQPSQYDNWNQGQDQATGGDSEFMMEETYFSKPKRRRRTYYNKEQVHELEKTYRQRQYIDFNEKTKLASAIKLTLWQVERWFANRRQKARRASERNNCDTDSPVPETQVETQNAENERSTFDKGIRSDSATMANQPNNRNRVTSYSESDVSSYFNVQSQPNTQSMNDITSFAHNYHQYSYIQPYAYSMNNNQFPSSSQSEPAQNNYDHYNKSFQN